MTSGVMETTAIEGAMRSLSTNVLNSSGGQEKKKVYPINFTEPDDVDSSKDFNPAYAMNLEDDEEANQETIESMASWGDSDALAVQAFEKDLEDLLQESQIFIQH